MPGFKEQWKQATPFLFYCVLTFACGDLIFGIDQSSFGALQALPSWLNTFGSTAEDGTKFLTTYQKSISNSIPFVGLAAGTTTFELCIERLGYQKLMYVGALMQVIAIIIQLTSTNWIVFTVGRVFGYYAVGYMENLVPSYSAEIAPPALRGFCSGLLTPVITMASVWGAGMAQAYATEQNKIGWMVPVAVQVIPAVLLFVCVPFTVESPRWLVQHGQPEKALKNLKKLRHKRDVDAGLPEAEIEALEHAFKVEATLSQAGWKEMFTKSTYRRRAILACLFFWFYQTTGNMFYNAYGPTFFVEIGLGAKSFTYATIVQLVGAIGSTIAILLTDRVGRRPLIIIGAVGLVIFDMIIAGLSASDNRSTAANNMIVASFILMLFSTKLSWATHCFLVASELGGLRMRKKIMVLGTTTDVIAAWLVSFTSPYIMNEPYGGIGGKIGFIFGGIAVVSVFVAIFFVPELRGRGLEEVDEMFETFHWGWQYKNLVTTGYGAQIAHIAGGDVHVAEQVHHDLEHEHDLERTDKEISVSSSKENMQHNIAHLEKV